MAGTVMGEMLGRVTIPVAAVPVGSTADAATITVPFSRWVFRGMALGNPSTSLATSTATVALRTASGGGGTALITAQGLTALLVAADLLDSTIAVGNKIQTAQLLYIHITQGVSPIVGTVDVVVEVQGVP